MNKRSCTSAIWGVVALLSLGAVAQTPPPDTTSSETPWPYEITSGNTRIAVYQPQIDKWDGMTLSARAAVAVREGAQDDPKSKANFGILDLSATTLVDKGNRLVTLESYQVLKADFPTAGDKAAAWTRIIRNDASNRRRTIALDRLEAGVAIVDAAEKAPLALRNDPPDIAFSTVPAMLIYIDGMPQFRAIPGMKWQRVVNTRPLLVRDDKGAHYLHVFDGWMTSAALDGRWSVANKPPADLEKIAKAAIDSHSADMLTGQGDPEQPAPSLKTARAPAIKVATRPTELIVFEGEPKWVPIAGTQLLAAENTTGRVFKLLSDQKTYVLVSGRWFRATDSAGPWQFVAANMLAKDFSAIPDDSKYENVKASVSGTPQSREAAIAAGIPSTAAVKSKEAKLTPPVIDGEPALAPIEGTTLHYVKNTATPIIQVGADRWYAVENGVWFVGSSVNGPWVVATSVPPVIYTIPATSPLHYVTYVKTFSASQDTVYVGYTPGYHGEYVDPVTNVVVYGTGYYYTPWIGTAWYGPPVTYGFGVATTYTPWAGWGLAFGIGWAWGAATVYSGWGWGCYPWWGPYGWGYAWGPPVYWGGAAVGPRGGAAVWGPGGWAASTGNVYSHWGNTARVSHASAGYNAWTGNAWAGRGGVSYNSRTGVLSAGQRGAVENVYTGNYASGGRGIARDTDSGVVAGGRGGTIGNADTGREISAGSGAIYNPNTGESTRVSGIGGDSGRVVNVDGDIYAGHDGNVYRHTDDGWEQLNRGQGPTQQRADDVAREQADRGQVDRGQVDRSQIDRQQIEQRQRLDRERQARMEGARRFEGHQRSMGAMRGMGGGRRR